jgi:hypothetical protein
MLQYDYRLRNNRRRKGTGEMIVKTLEEAERGALRIGSWMNTFYVYYEGPSLVQHNNEVVVRPGFKTREDANKWIDSQPD